jgi:hypothetical protein
MIGWRARMCRVALLAALLLEVTAALSHNGALAGRTPAAAFVAQRASVDLVPIVGASKSRYDA